MMHKRYRSYRNSMEMFLASQKGRRLLNVAYSWGAAVVIIGALFKLLHWPFGDQMLFIGMITEFLVFFISGFEKPEEQYRWEQVFPELDSKNPMDKEEMVARREYLRRKAKEAEERALKSTEVDNSERPAASNTYSAAAPATVQQVSLAGLPEEEVQRLGASITRLSQAIDTLSELGDLSASTLSQWQQLKANPEELGKQAQQYQEHMESLNHNLGSLNTLYESQLKDIEGQVSAIELINRRLDDIARNFSDSFADSDAFRSENAALARQLRELNRVYARLLEAMTVNMGVPGAMPYDRGGYRDPYYPTPSRYAEMPNERRSADSDERR